MLEGGMPESVITNGWRVNETLVQDIIQKDIMSRYALRKLSELKSILSYLFGNISNEVTYRSISRAVGIKSESTVEKYLEYIKETYLLFEVQRFSYKSKGKSRSPGKYIASIMELQLHIQEVSLKREEDFWRILWLYG